MEAALVRHQLHMLREALPGSHAARLRGMLGAVKSPALCCRGHRLSQSLGACWTIREVEPGMYEYVTGECLELP